MRRGANRDCNSCFDNKFSIFVLDFYVLNVLKIGVINGLSIKYLRQLTDYIF